MAHVAVISRKTGERGAEIITDRVSYMWRVFSSFLFFLTGPAGALQILTNNQSLTPDETGLGPGVENSSLSYAVRFALIASALALAFFSRIDKNSEKRLNIRALGALWVYILLLLVNLLAHSASLVAPVLQIAGVCAWCLYGMLIARSSSSRDEAIDVLIVGYLLACVAYALYSAIFWFTNPADNVQVYTGRYIGPFIGSTVATEISYGVLVIGLLLMLRLRTLPLGIGLAVLSLWVTFLTGVRSSSAASVVAIAIFLPGFLRIPDKSLAARIVRFVLVLGMVALAVLVFANADVLQQRVTGDALRETRRNEIWSFAWESFQKGSLLFGSGIRATFDYGVSTEGPVYASTIAWHNTWLGLLVESGILGLLAWSVIILAAAKVLSTRFVVWLRSPNNPSPWAIAAALIVLRYLLMSLTEMNLYLALSPGVMLFSAAFGVASIKRIPTKDRRNNTLHRRPVVSVSNLDRLRNSVAASDADRNRSFGRTSRAQTFKAPYE